MTATTTLSFDDGTAREIPLAKAIEVDTHGRQELGFRETANGWVITFTKSLKEGKTFGTRNFVTVSKDHAT